MALISLHNVNISFGGPAVLEHVTLQIERGERICLLGRNGEGKSTLMQVLSDTVTPDSGDIISCFFGSVFFVLVTFFHTSDLRGRTNRMNEISRVVEGSARRGAFGA